MRVGITLVLPLLCKRRVGRENLKKSALTKAAVMHDSSGVEAMKTSRRRPTRSTRSGDQRAVQREIKMFFRALSSYPDRFARDPELNFQQHLFSLTIPRPRTAEDRSQG